MSNDRSSRGRRPRRGYYRQRECRFCGDSSIVIDYKNVDLLKSFVSREGKIMARRATGTCARHQRELAVAVKRARHIALLPFVGEVLR